MTTSTVRRVEVGQVRALVQRSQQDGRVPRLLLIAAEPVWDGETQLVGPAGPVTVLTPSSVLDLRATLVEQPDAAFVVLTDQPEDQLGEEVLARAWRRQLQTPQAWDVVLSLFRAETLDPALRNARWLVELLVAAAPERGYPRPTNRLLDEPLAWSTVRRRVLGLPSDDPSTLHVLRWVASGDAATDLARVGSHRDDVIQRLTAEAGPAIPLLIDMADGSDPEQAVALGLAVGALASPEARDAQLVLLGRHVGSKPETRAEQDWTDAAEQFAQQLDAEDRRGLLDDADALLRSVAPEPHAVRSTLLGSGLDGARARVIAALADEPTESSAALENAVADVLAHDDAGTDDEATLHAAVRLRRWLQQAPRYEVGDRPFEALVDGYRREGAWVDAARHDLVGGTTDPALASALDTLATDIDDRRRARDRAFARAAADHVAASTAKDLASSRPVGIEHVLDAVVAPLAEHHPVLVLVLDGLSYAARTTLLPDLTATGWSLQRPESKPMPAVVAALPTVTFHSRASLLGGQLQTGDQAVERTTFAEHEGLRLASADSTPRLLHKADLRTADGHIASVAIEAINDTDQRVLGIVFNGVDDALGASAQLRLANGLDGLVPLADLLAEARRVGRVVVLASDHGHVLVSEDVAPHGGGGERWRPTDTGPATEREITIDGPRVLVDGQQAILAVDEGLRFNATRKVGYHGGATPAELLCPLDVLVTEGTQLEGWEPDRLLPPAWWHDGETTVDLDELTAPTGDASHVDPAPAQPDLFSPPAASAAADTTWIDALIASPTLAAQRRLAGNMAADDDTIRLVVAALHRAGGTASGAVLEGVLGVGPSRLRGKLTAVRKVLDVDGYNVLSVETDGTARLHHLRLAEQFAIDVPEPTR